MSATLRQNLLIAVALVAIVVILWLPFGFNVGFQLDGWVFYDKLNAAGLMGAVPPAPTSRPALNVIWLAAYAIDPNSYIGANILIIALLVAKGLLCVAMLYKLTRHQTLAFAFGALVLLLPADTGVFYLGALTLHLALLCWLLATYCLLFFYEARRLSVAMLVILSLLIGTLSYEIVFMFIPVGLLVLLAKARRVDRRFTTAAALYLIVPVVMAIRYALLWLGGASGVEYQNSLIDRSISVSDMLDSLARAIGRHFVGGWFGEGIVAYAPYAIAAGLIVGATVWWLLRRDSGVNSFPVSHREAGGQQIPSARLIGIGLLMIALGVALYLPTTERDNTIRTYYFSSLGAALVLAVVGWEITRRIQRDMVFAVFMGMLAVLGCWRLLEDHAIYRDRAAAQQQVLRQMMTVMQQVETPVSVLVLDATEGQTLGPLFHGSLYLRAAVSLIYDTYQLGLGICGDGEIGGSGYIRCEFGPVIAVQYLGDDPYVQTTYDRLIVLRYDESGIKLMTSLVEWIDTPVPYEPARLIRQGELARASGMLADG